MNLKRTLIFVIVVLIIGLTAYAFTYGTNIGSYQVMPVKDSMKYGLDLRGGVYIVLEAKPEPGKTVTDDMMERAIATIRRRVDGLGVSEPVIAKQGKNRIRIELPDITDSQKAIEIIGQTAQLKFLDPDGQLILTGENVKNAEAIYQQGKNGIRQPVVSLELDKEGAKAFDKATGEIMEIPDKPGVYEPERTIAILLDENAISVPEVSAHITDGKAVIQGMESLEAAGNLATLIKAGSLPVDMEAVDIMYMGPSLGANSLAKSVIAGLIGILIVILFMIVFYRIPGLVAGLALVVYILIVLAVLVSINATLTLPGIAGLILSIGMAVDANVIIFERLKEELRNGKSLRASISSGFSRAFRTILDANVTTLIAAAVLFYFGSGAIKGFAVTLSIGILSSMFTAVVVTRFLLKLVVGMNITKNAMLYGLNKGGGAR